MTLKLKHFHVIVKLSKNHAIVSSINAHSNHTHLLLELITFCFVFFIKTVTSATVKISEFLDGSKDFDGVLYVLDTTSCFSRQFWMSC